MIYPGGSTKKSVPQDQKVVIMDIRMDFGSMVAFMIKWVLASIPALIILTILGVIATAILAAVFRGFIGAFL